MNTDALTTWATTHPYPAAALAGLLFLLAAGALWCTYRALRSAVRPQASVVVASLAAIGCTAYGADTSWGFAEHRLGMDSPAERAALFFVAELALFACALMARANLRGPAGAPGTPGVLVWVIVGVQIIPAYSESGFWGGTVRAFIGSVLAGLMWHQAMGIELRHTRPSARSQGMAALLAREGRERLLSLLGLATRDRTAEQITRDRATALAVRLAARPKLRSWGRARLAAAVARAGVGADPEQRQQLLLMLSARRNAAALATIELSSPWVAEPTPEQPAVEASAALELEPAREALPTVPPHARFLPLTSRPAGEEPGVAEEIPAAWPLALPTGASPLPIIPPARDTSRDAGHGQADSPDTGYGTGHGHPDTDQDTGQDTERDNGQDTRTPDTDRDSEKTDNVHPQPKSRSGAKSSIRNTIINAVTKDGVDLDDDDTLQELVHAVHGDTKPDTWRKSYRRARQYLTEGQGFYP